MRWIAAGLFVAVLAVPHAAGAETHVGDYLARMGGESYRVAPRPMLALAAGVSTDLERVGATGEGDVGVTWGTELTSLFGELSLQRIAVGFRGSTKDDSTASIVAFYGFTMSSFAGYSIDFGLDARVSDDAAVGGFARATVRYGRIGVYARICGYLGGDPSRGGELGLSFDAIGMEQRHRE